MILLISALLAAQDEEVRATFLFIRASADERPRMDVSLKEVEGDLKEMSAYNAFDVVGSALVRFTPASEGVRTSLSLREGGALDVRFTPQQPFGGRILLKELHLLEYRAQEETTMTSGGVVVRSVKTTGFDVFRTSVEAPPGRLHVIGTAIVSGKPGPMTVVLAVRASLK